MAHFASKSARGWRVTGPLRSNTVMRPWVALFAAWLLWGAQTPAAGEGDDLFEAAASDRWEERWAAVRALARATDPKPLRVALLRDERPRVREAIAWACLLEPELGDATLLGLALNKDREAPVRRAAARALVHFRDRRAVSALITALSAEGDPRARLVIAETLRALTPAPCLLDPAAWASWWREHERDPRFEPADAAGKKGTYEGIVLETRTVAAIPGEGRGGRPPIHVLVLPQFGWSTAAYGPYLLPLRERATLTWVGLPTVQDLTGRSGFGGDLPVYPVDRLARALEKFRESHGIERCLLLAEGASGWFAMRYAQLYPARCSALVLIDTALDRLAYGEALRRGAARGNAAERWIAKTLLHENSVPFNEATLDRMQALGLAQAFHDGADLEIGSLFEQARVPQGFATVPDLVWGKRAKLDLPALFLYSAGSPFSGHPDMMRIGEHFPRSLVAPLKEARARPFIEANGKFHEVIHAFLEKFALD